MRERITRSRNATYLRELENFFRTYLVDEYPDRARRIWSRDYAGTEQYLHSVGPMRQAWRDILAPPELAVAGEGDITPDWLDGVRSWRIQQPLHRGLNAEAVLAMPEGGARRLVVFQHGLGAASTPERAFGVGDTDEIYDGAGTRLLDAGYAVLAPLNLTQIGPRNRAQRLARLAGTTMEGLEYARLQILLDLVAERFDLDTSRMGFWGSSWGGLAVQMFTPLDERFEVAVSSGFFNDRRAKMVVQDTRHVTFEDAGEDHAFLPGHLTAFSDADLASLICPRAFLVQIGELDAIGWWPDIVEEFHQARTHWDQLGAGDRIDIDLHKDGHVVRAEPGVSWIRRWLAP